ncbi:haloacid dehalogenase type II [Solirubrobacter ginsenosidimutans]|uniref:Haloacid dehalogenase type II n=1 Tax=Solirubrobacter ginsenosidimutans TaxID=490573 RepID=A0A9X3N262_9ACTN|nr:haloacid dehalogenase type II [Solirubrobacter ginsenosidimutans]MDA0165926.1 haloacid dehalogenase type II [Solirubrobacter ginsenosidimutans]
MRALLFDVFGTCVDWRTSMMREAERFGLPPQLAVAWRDEYQPQLETVRSGQRPWVNLDVLHEIGLNRVLRAMDLTLPKADRVELVRGWHRLDPWPDVVAGLTRLKETFIIAPCSNGHIAQSVNLAKFAKLPWDAILGAEIAHAYKPDPRVYRESVYALGLEPDEVCMVAAHRDDLRAAAAVGLQTAFVERFGEDPGPPFDADFVAHDFEELLR